MSIVSLAEAPAAVLAYVALGRLDEAGAILESHLVVPDIREGAATFTEVWRAYEAARGTNRPLPAEYDFRMRPEE